MLIVMLIIQNTLLTLARQMGADNFTYTKFRAAIDKQSFSPAQKDMLSQRLAILDSLISTNPDSKNAKQYFGPGKLVIVDLTDPFLDITTACALFEMVMGLFVEHPAGGAGKLLLLDEAHKVSRP